MASITFVAPIVRAAIATLKAELPDAIASYNAQDENDVILAEPTEYVFGAADPLVLTAGPLLEVASTDGQLSEFSIRRSEGDHDPRVSVVCWHEGERGELSPTYEMSLGLARCVIEVLARDGAFGAEVEISNAPGAISWRTDVIPADPVAGGREFLKWQVPVLVSFQLETVERFV